MSSSGDAMVLGAKLQDAGNLKDAEALFRQVLTDVPNDANAKYRLAVVCQMQGRAAEAIELYRQLLPVHPTSAKVHNNLGLAQAAQGQRAEALASYREAIRLQPDYAEAHNNLGNLLLSMNDAPRAVAAYRQAVTLKPSYSAAWINLGRACFDHRQWDEAIHCFSVALELQPGNVAVCNALGNAWLEKGSVEEADARYRRALQLRPEDAETHYNLARVAAALQRWSDAAASLRTSLKFNAASPRALAMLGDICYCHLANGEEALWCYERVLALTPDNAKARLLSAALTRSAQLPVVPAGFITATYDPLAERFDQYVGHRGDCSPQWLHRALGPPPAVPNLTVLDLGCGTGLCGLQFRSWAQTLVGVDLSANMLAKARARGIYDELIQGDILVPLKQAGRRFDLILASDVLLYVGDLAPLFDAVKNALRPAGRFAFTVDLLQDGNSDYRLTPWVLFAHAPGYLERVAQQTHLQILGTQPVAFPRDGGVSTAGLVMVLSHP